jgi:hypothetical protein
MLRQRTSAGSHNTDALDCFKPLSKTRVSRAQYGHLLVPTELYYGGALR